MPVQFSDIVNALNIDLKTFFFFYLSVVASIAGFCSHIFTVDLISTSRLLFFIFCIQCANRALNEILVSRCTHINWALKAQAQFQRIEKRRKKIQKSPEKHITKKEKKYLFNMRSCTVPFANTIKKKILNV